MTTKQYVEWLDSLSGDDPEDTHDMADHILKCALRENGLEAIAQAYNRVKERCEWWSCA